MIQINLIDLIRLNNSNKQFLLYDKQNNTITNYRLTNNIDNWMKHYQHMTILQELKKELKVLTIKL
jgi:hypothetical protein